MDDNLHGWREMLWMFIDHPEKSTLIFLLIVGVWRYLLELIRENRESAHHETLLESLMRENKELRDRLLKETERHPND